jgi:hypothetical protein
MEMEDMTILSCKIGKKIVMGYSSYLDGYGHILENDETPSEKLKNAINAFNRLLADCFYVEKSNDAAHFITNGFVVHEKKGVFYLEIKGKCVTRNDDIVTVSSGKIPYEEGGETINGAICDKLQDARLALYNFMFAPKPEQGELPYEK